MANKTKRKQKNNNKSIIAIAIIVILLILTTIITIGAIKSNIQKAPMLDLDTEIAEGVDVSSHNGKIDWSKMSKNIDFAIIRVGYRGYSTGEIVVDKKAKTNLKNATKSNVPIGAYFYTQAINENEAIEEAKLVIDTVKGYDISLPIFIDYEYAYNSDGNIDGRLHNANLTKKEATAVINAFCKEIKKAGYTPGVYASSSLFAFAFRSSAIDKDAVIWVADYNKKVSYNVDYDIWQYTKKGKVDGNSSKYIDKDRWYLNKTKN